MGRQAHMLSSNIGAAEGTFFSQERFIRAVARAETPNVRVLKLQSANSPAHLFGLEYTRTHNRRSVSLAPFGLPAYPTGAGQLQESIPVLLRQLKTLRTTGFDWNVRFDHHDLAKQLDESGLTRIQGTTHILRMDRPYDGLFRGFSETARNKVRRAERNGVVVCRATEHLEVEAYYALYEQLITERTDWKAIYKRALFDELFKVRGVMLLLAKLDGIIIGGGWFIRDGNSSFYWQGAMNYQYKRYFPHYAIINSAIRCASEKGMASFNMGVSTGIQTLEQFKSFWGARKVACWTFVWRNPVWRSVARIRSAVRW
jgi:hypothetical protein